MYMESTMAITQSDRNVPIMAHVRAQTKERLILESERRKISMSALISELLERELVVAEDEEVAFKRSNKRGPIDPLKDIPLPLDREACTNYSRPEHIMGGPCLNCGCTQPEHVK
jgi:hypothetical protein